MKRAFLEFFTVFLFIQLSMEAAETAIIIDNSDAEFSGKWYSTSEGVDKYGSDFRYTASSDGDLTAVAVYKPKNISPGNYDVEIWYSAAENRSPNVSWIVWHDGRKTTTRVNQQVNGGRWITIAEGVRFVGTSDECIFVSNFGAHGSAVIADAVRLIASTASAIMGTSTLQTPIVLDNDDAIFEGTWSVRTATSQRFGKDYRFCVSALGSATATATYRPNITKSGRYDVEIFYPSGPNRADASCWIVSCQSGTLTNKVNQRVGGGAWLKIGKGLTFNAGTNGFVKVTNEAHATMKSVVIADGVRFVPNR